MARYVPRTKAERGKLRSVIETPRGLAVTLACGHQATKQPGITKTGGRDYWWCCNGWQARRKRVT